MIIEVKPDDTDDVDFDVPVFNLDGKDFLFRLRWNRRDESWYMDVFTAQRDPIELGIRLVVAEVLAGTCIDARIWPGLLCLVDTEGEAEEAGFDDLGKRHRLVYETIDDIRSVRTAAEAALRAEGFFESNGRIDPEFIGAGS